MPRIYGNFIELAGYLTETDSEDLEVVESALMEKWEISYDTFEEVAYCFIAAHDPAGSASQRRAQACICHPAGERHRRALVQIDVD